MIEIKLIFASVSLACLIVSFLRDDELDWDTPSIPITPTPSQHRGKPVKFIVKGNEVPTKSILGDLIIPKSLAEHKFDQIKKQILERNKG